jgi:hypothetical protein
MTNCEYANTPEIVKLIEGIILIKFTELIK